jgi:alanine dehydrogenase
MMKKVSFGFARIHAEPGEVRDFLPELMGRLMKDGADVYLEQGYGSGMGLSEADYREAAPGVKFVSQQEAYEQDVVVVLRYPGDAPLRWMRPGACLVSMLHYPTRPGRVAYLHSLGIEAISLDSLADDQGKRLVENLRAVAWNGLNVAFQVLREHYPVPVEDKDRNPVKVTVMGVGAVGLFAIQAAVRYGDEEYWHKMAAQGVTGVQVSAVEYDLTGQEAVMKQIMKYTDILVDATQRPDASKAVIPNAWIAQLRPHAVLLDLSVDPYLFSNGEFQSVKGIEGVPQGNLNQFVFAPDDPAYEAIPDGIDTTERRYAVSCYSWPGIMPKACMEVYGNQLKPMLMGILQVGGVEHIEPEGFYFHRAIARALLSRWASS